MSVFQYHVFVCDQVKAEGLPSCSSRGGGAVLDALRAEIARRGLTDTVGVTMSGSLGLCERGPNMVVYPESTWYSGVQPSDIPELVESHFQHGRPVERLLNTDVNAVRAEIGQNRMRFVNSLKAKDASGALPDPLQQTIRAFQDSRAILTAIELDVFSAVGTGANAPAVASRVKADPRATEMLLNALVALKLLDKRGTEFSNTPIAARYLAATGKDDSRAALKHWANMWQNWTMLTDAVREGTAPSHTDTVHRGEAFNEAFIAAMHKNAGDRADAVVGASGVNALRRMLDIGGGSGAYSIAFAKAFPGLQIEILDVPAVTPIAQRHIVAANLQDRIRTRDGDLRDAALGDGFDVILLSAICHMLSPDENQALLARCFAATAAGGRLVIQDFVLDASKTSPKSGALFALNMLVGTRAGGSYSEEEYTAWLRGAGYASTQCVRLPGPTGLMIGVKA